MFWNKKKQPSTEPEPTLKARITALEQDVLDLSVDIDSIRITIAKLVGRKGGRPPNKEPEPDANPVVKDLGNSVIRKDGRIYPKT